MSVVPRSVRLSAVAVAVCGTLTGLVVGVYWQMLQQPTEFAIRGPLTGVGAGLVLSCLIAVWLLALGYVYGDARRREMRAVLWVVVAALFPHLLGFLLYFVMRQPMASRCTRCGMPVTPPQRFCSWCGEAQGVTAQVDARLAPEPLK